MAKRKSPGPAKLPVAQLTILDLQIVDSFFVVMMKIMVMLDLGRPVNANAKYPAIQCNIVTQNFIS
ncbi:hypothetical protein BELL_1214g00020 [Botrytis elliptica]|uniref:Uncharacterized protein n=1 Tax=Botrytis elliptica TaxID=278938 RepID=A0A4Z1ITP7_9HELO|nr:hypothetical protein BELL_1214g00020 [Botrytis elliptica]